jgi:hypothetical protein
MTGYIFEKNNFLTAAELIADAVGQMIDNGFTQKYPVSAFDPQTAGEAFSVTLEASVDVDPLAATQPWRVRFEALEKDLISVIVATPTQLPDDGSFAKEVNASNAPVDIIGAVGAIATGGNIVSSSLSQGFINRGARVGDDGNSYPMSYRLSISPRGFFLGTWEDAVTAETSAHFNWILVQRPVDRDTGEVVITGKAPVWCVNSTADTTGITNNIYQFVVRESDILRPEAPKMVGTTLTRRSATQNQDDSEAIINPYQQVRLTEDGKYVINFPSRLNSSRYRYSHELDMIATTSADVVSQESIIDIEVYGENDGATPTPNPTPRKYKALQANYTGNTGMRVLVLHEGGGIDAI